MERHNTSPEHQLLTDEERQQSEKDRMAKIMAMPRNQKRRYLSIRHTRRNRPFNRTRSGIPTGTTAHFAAWMADLDVKRALYGIKLDRLADELNGELAAAFAILRVNGGIRNVFDLSRCDVHYLLSVQQIGPSRLAAVEKYLRARNVSLNWTTA